MERLYTDASYSSQSGIGGIAVVAPKWSAIYGNGLWRSKWDIHFAREAKYDVIAFCTSCPCRDSMDAEKRALELAFFLAYDMIVVQEDAGRMNTQVEIITDSLMNFHFITTGNTRGDPILKKLCRIWNRERIVLTHIKGHAGNLGNELADKWSKHIRLEAELNIQRNFNPAAQSIY